MKKDSGMFKNVLSFIPAAMITFFAFVILLFEVYQASSSYIEDALVASNLASAVIDVEEYGISHTLVVKDPREACAKFKRDLCMNLSLNQQWESSNKSLIDGRVTLEEYSLYEVRGNDVIQYCFPGGKEETMYTREFPAGAGDVEAPDGTRIESTSVYSKITFQVNYFGKKLDVFKQKCVDIVEN